LQVPTSFQLPSLCRQSPSYKFSGAEISVLLNALEEHHLTCTLSLDGAGDIWKAVTDQIIASLSRAGIILALSPGESSDSKVHPSSQSLLAMPGVKGDSFLSRLTQLKAHLQFRACNASRLL
jgi:hypothetical protein